MYYYSLPKYLVNELERVQMGALKIMCPSLSYDEALTHMEIAPLSVHHSNICATLFNEILSDSDHRLNPKLKENVPRCLKAKNKTNFCRKLQIVDTSDRKQMATRWSATSFPSASTQASANSEKSRDHSHITTNKFLYCQLRVGKAHTKNARKL